MPLSYPYKQNEEDKEIPTLTFFEDTLTPFEQLPDDDAEQLRHADTDVIPSKPSSQNGKRTE